MQKIKECVICHIKYLPKSNWIKSRFCSRKCQHIAQSTEFKDGRFNGKNNPFYGKHHTKETIDKINHSYGDRFGENSANWKGGIQVNNPNYYKTYNHIYSKTHWKKYRNRYKEMAKLWRIANRERCNATNKRWRENNEHSYRMIVKACSQRRRALGKISKDIIQSIYEDNIKKYGTLTCYLCEKPIQFGQDSIDHKIPISKGGTNIKNNLEITHLRCNLIKHNKLIIKLEDSYENALVL